MTAKDLLSKFDVDFLRYYFAKNISDRKDLNYSQKDFEQSVNGELINNWGNLVNRTLSFVKNKFEGKIGRFSTFCEIKEKIENTFENTCQFVEQGKVSNAIKGIFELVDFANKYFDKTEPWKVIKEDRNKAEELCYNYLQLIVNFDF